MVIVLLLVATQAAVAQQRLNECGRIANQVDTSCNSPTEICDPCYKLQWHLKNTGQNAGSTSGTDINIEPVWKKDNLGQGIFIGIMDVEIHDHEDLRENLSIKYSHDYYLNTTDGRFHGVIVAGIAAARANHIGVRGVAPLATFYSLNILSGAFEDKHVLDAMTRHAPITAVANNSWGPAMFKTLGSDAWEMAIETGIDSGFYGKGTVYVFATGNHHCENNPVDVCGADSVNYNGNANYHAVIAVGAVNDLDKVSYYSERGANLWLCAPSSDSPPRTPYRTGNWTTSHDPSKYSRGGGTSSAAPIVSGVVALMRHANPDLTWRDVKLILANSARRNIATDDEGWHIGAMKLGAFAERYHFNRECGFGVVDANAAVSLAERWVNLPPRIAAHSTTTSSSMQNSQTIRSTINIQSDIDFIEYVDINTTLNADRWYELGIRLISPSGTTSRLIKANTSIGQDNFYAKLFPSRWRFGSAKHLGEASSGNWRLEIDGTLSFSLAEWGLTIRGYKILMNATTPRTLVEGDIKEDAPNSPLRLSLAGAKWRPNLQVNEFKLINAPPGLRVATVSTGTHTVHLTLALDGEGFADDYQFQVEASTGTVSNLNRTLMSDEVKILSNKPTVNKTVLAPDGAVGLPYDYTIPADTFKSAEALTYEVSGEMTPGLSIDPTTLIISGTPTTTGTYSVTLTARMQDGKSATTPFNLRIRPRGHPIVVNPIRDHAIHTTTESFERDGVSFRLNLNGIFTDSGSNPTTLSYTISGHPDWLNYDSEAKMLSGTTTRTVVAEHYKITITATDQDNNPTDTTFELRVATGLYIRSKVFLEALLQ